MTQVSKRPLSKTTQERILNLFICAIVSCKSSNSAGTFILDLFTPTERIMLAKRFSIAYMLLEGYDYKLIMQVLKVSTATVGHVSYWIKNRGGVGIKEIIILIKRDESLKDFLDNIKITIEEMIASVRGQNWSRSHKVLWQHKRDLIKPF